MQVRLLGPVDVLADGRPLIVPGLRRKAVLAALAVCPGDVVSVERLLDIGWGSDPARRTAVRLNTLQSHVSSLRRILGGPTAIVARPPGYALDLGETSTDVTVAERLIRRGRRSSDPAASAEAYRAALALWRGNDALAEVADLPHLGEHGQRLARLRTDTLRRLIDARLGLGEHAGLADELRVLVEHDPFDEQLHAQLMVALYRSGRQAEALAVHSRLRQALAAELGIEPGPLLRRLEEAILRQDAALDVGIGPAAPAAPIEVAAPGAGAVPAQLPAPVRGFVGRADEIARLDALLHDGAASGEPVGTVVVSAVSGMAGVGKTALAVHWGRRVAARFPDGQLYVNLRGFHPRAAPLDPAAALRDVLEALGFDPQRLPTGLDALAALYRSVLSGRRLLVLLDNARDADQVRPLLPAAPGCLAVVTSRAKLTSLVAVEGAIQIMLDVLVDAEARELIAHRIGTRRAAAEAGAVDQITALCARLPLALAIVGARAASEPAIPLDTYRRHLGDRTGALDVLYAGDAAADVRAVFSWSLSAVSPAAARLFRLLGLHPGLDFTPAAAASLAGSTAAEAARDLAELAEANLLTEHRAGRYTFHDLLRAYAALLVRSEGSGVGREAATHRLIDHYLHTAYAATWLLSPLSESITLADPAPGVTAERLEDPGSAVSWFSAERPALLAVVDQALAAGLPRHVWQIAWSVNTYLRRAGFWLDLIAILRKGAATAGDADDPGGRASCLRLLASLYAHLGRHEDAHRAGVDALGIAQALGDPSKQAMCHNDLGFALYEQGRPHEAIAHLRDALRFAEETGDVATQGLALDNLGWAHTDLGECATAISLFERALILVRAAREPDYEVDVWIGSGRANHALGQHERAIACYRTAAQMANANGNAIRRTDALTRLGEAQEAVRDTAGARTSWRLALRILTELQHPNAERVRTRLARLGVCSTPGA